MNKIENEADKYKKLPIKDLKKVIKGYKWLLFANSDICNFIFTFLCILIPYTILVKFSFFTFTLVILFHYFIFWRYLHQYKKSKLVSDGDKKEIEDILTILEDTLKDKTKNTHH